MENSRSPLVDEVKMLRSGYRGQEDTQKEQKKYVVTDTSWWLNSGYLLDNLFKVKNIFWIIPSGVMQELDGLKRNNKVKEKAVKATKIIKNIISHGKGTIYPRTGIRINALESKVDEEVILTAKAIKQQENTSNVIILTTDYALSALALKENIQVAKDCGYIYDGNIGRTGLFIGIPLLGFSYVEGWFLLSFLSIIIIFFSIIDIGYACYKAFKGEVHIIFYEKEECRRREKQNKERRKKWESTFPEDPFDPFLDDPASASIGGNIYHHDYELLRERSTDF